MSYRVQFSILASFLISGSCFAQFSGGVPTGLPTTPQNQPAKPLSAKPPETTKPQKIKPSFTAPTPTPRISETTRAFITAVSNSNFKLADLLLEQGADVNCGGCMGMFVADVESQAGNVQGGTPDPRLVFLLSKGSDPNKLNERSRTALMEAITYDFQNGKIQRGSFNKLLDMGADPKVKDNEGNTALHHLARIYINPDQSPTDIQQDIRLKRFYENTFERASSRLVSRGGDINAKNDRGITPLMMLSTRCNANAVRHFIQLGANARIKNNDGKTALDYGVLNAAHSTGSCNGVITALKSVSDGKLALDAATSTQQTDGDWEGLFHASSPRAATTPVKASITKDGVITFSSQAGLVGSGNGTFIGEKFNGSIAVKAPTDEYGRPAFSGPDGSSQFEFLLQGTNQGGVIRGTYSSNIESGEFVMCAKGISEKVSECKPPAGPSLAETVNGVFSVIRTLSNTIGGSSGRF